MSAMSESEPAWRAKIVCIMLSVCICASVYSSRKLWCPWFSSVYRKEMFVQANRKEISRGKDWETHTDTKRSAQTHTCSQQCKKRNLTGAPVFVSEVDYLLLGKWEWLGWALTVFHYPPRWLPMQTPADRKAIDSSPLNLQEQDHGLPGLFTPIHTSCLHHQLYSFNSYVCCCNRHLIDYLPVCRCLLWVSGIVEASEFQVSDL